eukprot:scaffold10399_cov94-Isochrysis_galbana.AAC.8
MAARNASYGYIDVNVETPEVGRKPKPQTKNKGRPNTDSRSKQNLSSKQKPTSNKPKPNTKAAGSKEQNPIGSKTSFKLDRVITKPVGQRQPGQD